MKYRAFCNECSWASSDAWNDQDAAYADVNQHVQEEHAWQWGVLEEPS